MLPAKMPTLSTMGPEFSQFQPILQAMENESERARKEHVRQKKRRQLIPDPRESRRNFAEEAMQLAQVGAVLSVVPTALDESVEAASWNNARPARPEQGHLQRSLPPTGL